MKTKNLILVLGLLLSFHFYAQTEKGHFLIAANSNFSFTSVSTSVEDSDAEVNNTYLNFSSAAGYFITDNLSIGLLANYFNGEKHGLDTSSFLAGPFARYYFAKSEKLLPFAQTSMTFGSNSYTFSIVNIDDSSVGTKEVSSDIFGYEMDLGLSILLSKQISFDIILGYAHTKENTPYIDLNGTETTTEKNTGAFGLNLGFSVFLGK